MVFVFSILNINLYSSQKVEAKKELKEQIKTYANSNIKAQLDIWKSKIDKAMSVEDLVKLNELRSKAHTFHQQTIEIRNEFKAKLAKGEITKDELKDKMKSQFQSFKPTMEELKALLKKNATLTKEVVEEAKPLGKKWKDDIQEIVLKWKETNKTEMTGKAGKEFSPKLKDIDKGKIFIAKIFLYKGEMDLEGLIDNEQDQPMQKDNNSNNDIQTMNFPNPFTEKTTITVATNSVKNLKITIIDSRGNLIKDLFNGKLSPGKHDYEFIPKSGSVAGSYFVEINGNGIKTSHKMIYKK